MTKDITFDAIENLAERLNGFKIPSNLHMETDRRERQYARTFQELERRANQESCVEAAIALELIEHLVSKKELLERSDSFYRESHDHRYDCRDYLMAVDPNDLTVEDCLEALGFGRNGLNDR